MIVVHKYCPWVRKGEEWGFSVFSTTVTGAVYLKLVWSALAFMGMRMLAGLPTNASSCLRGSYCPASGTAAALLCLLPMFKTNQVKNTNFLLRASESTSKGKCWGLQSI